MFGIDAVDLVLIIILAVVMFGPEKLPEYSRKAARIFVYLRDIANNAKTTIGNELGPEYANMELRDLHPKAFIAKHLKEEVALLDEAKRELEQAQRLLKETTKDVEGVAESAKDAVRQATEKTVDEPEAGLIGVVTSPFDPEAT